MQIGIADQIVPASAQTNAIGSPALDTSAATSHQGLLKSVCMVSHSAWFQPHKYRNGDQLEDNDIWTQPFRYTI